MVHAEIRNKLGLHARPAMSFVDTASQFQCRHRDPVCARRRQSAGETGRRRTAEAGGGVDGKSIMQDDDARRFREQSSRSAPEGDDAEETAESLKNLIDSGFDED